MMWQKCLTSSALYIADITVVGVIVGFDVSIFKRDGLPTDIPFVCQSPHTLGISSRLFRLDLLPLSSQSPSASVVIHVSFPF